MCLKIFLIYFLLINFYSLIKKISQVLDYFFFLFFKYTYRLIKVDDRFIADEKFNEKDIRAKRYVKVVEKTLVCNFIRGMYIIFYLSFIFISFFFSFFYYKLIFFLLYILKVEFS